MAFPVTPANAGVQSTCCCKATHAARPLDSCVRRNDDEKFRGGSGVFCRMQGRGKRSNHRCTQMNAYGKNRRERVRWFAVLLCDSQRPLRLCVEMVLKIKPQRHEDTKDGVARASRP